MKNIFLVYGHYNDNSFNAAIRETFLEEAKEKGFSVDCVCLLYTSPSPRDYAASRMPSSA